MATSTTTTPFIPIRLAQTIGITLSSFLGGANLSISFYLIPGILQSPAPLLLRQWQKMYDVGKATIPPMSIVAASAYFYLAYALRAPVAGGGHSPSFWGYIVAGALSASMIPYTLVLMMSTNGKLMSKAAAVTTVQRGDDEEEVVTELGEETAHKLADRWGVLNLGRGGMLFAAGILGAWTALE